MNILFLNDTVFEDSPGGSSMAMRELGRQLVKRGHRITILVPKTTPHLPDEEMTEGITIVRYSFNRNRVGAWASLLIAARRTFGQLLTRGRVDLVHAHFAYASLGPLLSPGISRLASVRTFYGPWADEGRIDEVLNGREALWDFIGRGASAVKYLLRQRIEGFSLSRSDPIIALSQYSRQHLIERYCVDSRRIRVIPGGVDSERFKPAADKAQVRAWLGLPRDKVILITVRRLIPRMGLENLIRAMGRIARENRDIFLLIGGAGRLKDSLQTLINGLHLSREVRMLGFIPEEVLPLYYQAADICVLPSVALEGFGLVTLEALASGLPVLGTPVGATPEILGRIDKEFLLPGTEPEDVAQGILRFVKQRGLAKHPPQELRRFVLQEYTWELVGSLTEAVYHEAVQRKQGKAESVRSFG